MYSSFSVRNCARLAGCTAMMAGEGMLALLVLLMAVVVVVFAEEEEDGGAGAWAGCAASSGLVVEALDPLFVLVLVALEVFSVMACVCVEVSRRVVSVGCERGVVGGVDENGGASLEK